MCVWNYHINHQYHHYDYDYITIIIVFFIFIIVLTITRSDAPLPPARSSPFLLQEQPAAEPPASPGATVHALESLRRPRLQEPAGGEVVPSYETSSVAEGEGGGRFGGR